MPIHLGVEKVSEVPPCGALRFIEGNGQSGYHAYMNQKISFDEVLDLWGQAKRHDQIYLHFPFCTTNCRYCVYRGYTEKDDNIKQTYYQDILPKRILDYKDVIKGREWNVLYLGGGTVNCDGDFSSIIPAMETLSMLNPSFREKVIEIHTGFRVTEADIDLIASYGFTTAILCVQTFDRNKLREEGRVNAYTTKEEVRYLIRELHKRGIKVGIDLIGFRNLAQTSIDLMTLIEDKDSLPDEITVASLYQDKEERLGEIREFFNDLSPVMGEYYNLPFDEFVTEDSLKCFNCYRMYRKDVDTPYFYSFTDYLDDSENRGDECVLGIGSYRNQDKDTYSVINGYIGYSERLENMNENPEFFLTRKMTFWDKCRRALDWLESQYDGNNPSFNTEVRFRNNPEGVGHTNDVRDRSIETYLACDRRCMTEIDLRVIEALRTSDMEAIQIGDSPETHEDCV